MATDAYSCALNLLAALPTGMRALVEALPHDLRSWRPSPAEWSIRDVLAHLLDAEISVTRPRIEQMIAQDNPLLAVAPLVTPAGDAGQLLEAWATARAADLPFFRALTPGQLARTGRHPRHGTLSVRELVIELAYHDQDHLHQIAATIQAALYPDLGHLSTPYTRPT